MSKKDAVSAQDNTILELKALAKEKEDVRRQLAITAEDLRLKAEQLAMIAKEKEDVRLKLAETTKELRL